VEIVGKDGVMTEVIMRPWPEIGEWYKGRKVAQISRDRVAVTMIVMKPCGIDGLRGADRVPMTVKRKKSGGGRTDESAARNHSQKRRKKRNPKNPPKKKKRKMRKILLKKSSDDELIPKMGRMGKKSFW